MKITEELVGSLAERSALRLTRTEAKMMTIQLERILQSMEVLKQAEEKVFGEKNSGQAADLKEAALSDLRPDCEEKSMERCTLLQNAPETDGVYWIVPKTVE